MISKGSFVIIENSENKVLLVKRKDIPFWDLPGGAVNTNESEICGAIREVFEETGLEVEIKYLIGCYSQNNREDNQYIYHGKVTGGKMISEGKETKEIKFFSRNKLPLNLIPLRKMQLQDFSNGKRDIYTITKERKVLFLIEKLLKIVK